MHRDVRQPRHVAEGDGFAEEREDGVAAAGGAQAPVFVVGGGGVPGAEAGGALREGVPWRVVRVGEGH